MFEDEPIIENDLENFYDEIQALKEKEVVSKKSFLLTDLDPYNLTAKDMKIYKRYERAEKSELEEVRVEFEEYRDELQNSENEDSKIFAGYLGNVLMLKIEEDLLKEWRE